MTSAGSNVTSKEYKFWNIILSLAGSYDGMGLSPPAPDYERGIFDPDTWKKTISVETA